MSTRLYKLPVDAPGITLSFLFDLSRLSASNDIQMLDEKERVQTHIPFVVAQTGAAEVRVAFTRLHIDIDDTSLSIVLLCSTF